MTNIWKYKSGEKVRITDVDGVIYFGNVLDITDVEERSDLERQEDGIGIIIADGKHIEFYKSDIKDIRAVGQ